MSRVIRPAIVALLFLGIAAGVLHAALTPGAARLPGVDSVTLYTWETFTRWSLAQGTLPYWNPFHFAGTPYLADVEPTVLYPPAAFLRLWLAPIPFLAWMAALHLTVAGLGGVFLGRTVGLRWLTAVGIGVAVMLGGSTAGSIHNGHLLLLGGTAWLPWAMAFAIRSTRRPSWLPHPGVVVVLVLQFLAGYLQGSVYVAAATAAWFVFAALSPGVERAQRARCLVQLGLVGAFAGGLSAFELLPMARLSAAAARTAGMSFADAVVDGWLPRDLRTILYPFSGAADGEVPFRTMSDRMYVGWTLVAVAPLAFFDRRLRPLAGFFAVLVALAVGLALGTTLPLYRLHHLVFPGFRIPGRTLFVATMSIAVLGGIGLEVLMERMRAHRWGILAVPVAIVAGAAAIGNAGDMQGSLVPHWLMVSPSVVALLAAVLVAWRVGPAPAMAIAVGAIAVEMYAYAGRAVGTVGMESPETIAAWLGPPQTVRALTLCDNRVGRSEFLLHRQPTIDGSGGVYLRDFRSWSELAAAGSGRGDRGSATVGMRRDLLDQLNVGLVASCTPLEVPGLSLASHVEPVYSYRNDTVRPRAFTTCLIGELTVDEVRQRLWTGRYDDAGALTQPQWIMVRWAESVSDEARRELEQSYGLFDPSLDSGRTWQYDAHQASRDTILRLIRDPAAEDTAGLDRRTGEFLVELAPPAVEPGDDRTEALADASACDRGDARVVVNESDRPDGRVTTSVASTAGTAVFFSEPWYVERRAFVDGRPAETIRANLAFTAVRVPPGSHRVELRYVPDSLRAGLGAGALTLVAWAGLLWLARRPSAGALARRDAASPAPVVKP